MDAAIFRVGAYTGLRCGELLALRWRDVDFADSRLTVEVAMSAGEVAPSTKGGRFRTVPLMDKPARELEALSRRDYFTGRDDRVFSGATGRPLDRSALRKRFVRAQEAAGVRPRRFHDLRHTFGSLAVRAPGWSAVDVQQMMGHASLRTTERYLHAKPRGDDAARLARAFEPENVPSIEVAAVKP